MELYLISSENNSHAFGLRTKVLSEVCGIHTVPERAARNATFVGATSTSGLPTMDTRKTQLPPVQTLLFDRPAALPAWSAVAPSPAAFGPAQPPSVPEPSVAPRSPPVSRNAVGDSLPLTRRERPPAMDMKANLRRSRHRDRAKRDMMFLQAYRHELEGELERLQRARAERLRVQRQQQQQHLVRDPRLDEQSYWRALALLRQRQRKHSEQENARLCALWQMQLRLAAQMGQAVSVPQSVGPANGCSIAFTDADPGVFIALLNDLDDVYRRSGPMIEESWLEHSAEESFRRARHQGGHETLREATRNDTEVVAVELIRSTFESVQERMLSAVVVAILMRGGALFDVGEQQSGDTLAVKVRILLPATTQDNGCVDLFMVMRKYVVAPGRAVYVWRSLKVGDGCLAGIVEAESSFCAVSRSQHEANCSFVRRVRRLEPMTWTPTTHDDAGKSELLNKFNLLSLTEVENDINAVMRRVEGRSG